MLLVHAHILHLFGNQVTACNLYLLFRDIPAHFNQLHTVKQGSRNGVQVICRSDEHHFRQIVIDIQEVVMESIVLFRVQDLQKSRRRVSIDGSLTHFVDLVQNKHGVG